MSSQIKVLLLDAGGVLIKLNWDNFYKTLRIPKVINGVDLKNWLDKHSLHNDLEKGLISFEVFFEDFQSKFHLPITIDEFKKAWNSVLDGTHKGLGVLLREVSTNLPIYILSNTNKTHFNFYSKWKPFNNFKGYFLSYDLGCRKPEKEIYVKVLEKLNVKPQEILFVDDLNKNLEAAQSFGIKTEHSINSTEKLRGIFNQYNLLP